jgi:hypothetical protein
MDINDTTQQWESVSLPVSVSDEYLSCKDSRRSVKKDKENKTFREKYL